MEETAQQYGSLIAIVSGIYSLWAGGAGMEMTGADWLMVVLGVGVLAHGVVLLASPETVGDASGPLMVVWGALMLLTQGWMAATVDHGMAGGMDGTMGGQMGGAMMAWNPGMVAVAAIMLGSGLLMWTDEGM